MVEKSFCTHFTEYRFKYYSTLHQSVDLLACEENSPPEYKGSACTNPVGAVNVAIRTIGHIKVDLKDIPSEAFVKGFGPDGPYYKVTYDISIIFGAVMEFKLSHGGKIVGQGTADYLE